MTAFGQNLCFGVLAVFVWSNVFLHVVGVFFCTMVVVCGLFLGVFNFFGRAQLLFGVLNFFGGRAQLFFWERVLHFWERVLHF